MGIEAQRFYKRLAEMLAEKRSIEMSSAVNWIRAKLSFILVKTALLCIRGSRSVRSSFEHIPTTDIPVAVFEAKVR